MFSLFSLNNEGHVSIGFPFLFATLHSLKGSPIASGSDTALIELIFHKVDWIEALSCTRHTSMSSKIHPPREGSTWRQKLS